MDPHNWFRLQVHWSEIVSQEIFDGLIGHLHSATILTKDDIDRLQFQSTPKEKMENLLMFLKKKPQSTNAFELLMEALQRPEVETSWLVDMIKATPISAEAIQIPRGDSIPTEKRVRCTLLKYFKGDTGKETPIEVIMNVVRNLTATDINVPTIDPQLKHEPKVSSLTCSDLKSYLANKLRGKGLKEDILVDIETNDISGEVFLSLTQDELPEFFPSASLGVRRYLDILIKDLSETISGTRTEEHRVHLRMFDEPVQEILQYRVGCCCDTTNAASERLTQAVRCFELVDNKVSDDQKLRDIAALVVAFASACLSQYRNGTVYFGISPNEGDGRCYGEVVGVALPKEDVQSEITEYLKQSIPNQQTLVMGTVRSAKFVPVVEVTDAGLRQLNNGEVPCWVIEVDINPSSKLVADEKFLTLLKLLPIEGKKGVADGVFGFSEDGHPELLTSEERFRFERLRPRLLEQRKHEEAERHKQDTPCDLRQKFLNLLTAGAPIMQDNVYPFLMLSPLAPHMDQEYLSAHMPFVKYLGADLVLDFDTKGCDKGLYHNLENVQGESMRVLIPDNFNKGQQEKESIDDVKNSLTSESSTAWVFCNGYEHMGVESKKRLDWKRKHKSGFSKALEYFIDRFGEERIILIICLFSDNYEVMVEGCEEAILKLSGKWMVIAESENIVKEWSRQILERCCCESKDLEQRLVIGMSWAEINTTILQATQRVPPEACMLPTGSGARVQIPDKKLKDWCDLEIVSANEITLEEKDPIRAKKGAEENFYRGEEVSWSNFWYADQVLERDIHGALKQRVTKVLAGSSFHTDEMSVSVVSVLHQPGAGGTTSAKQILWNLRSEFRCCIVRTISDTTAEQIDDLRKYDDQRPGPVLVLIDNEDDEKYVKLKGELEENANNLWKGTDTDDKNHVYCCVLLCVRRASLPNQAMTTEITLRQELSLRELQWFKSKSETLHDGYKKDQQGNLNPKFLISFNILKENFNKDYIKKVVKEFTDEVKPNEYELLTLVSFFNLYDPFFKPVRVSCLDRLINPSPVQNTWGNTRKLQWEAQLSQAIRVLLNLSTNRDFHRKPRTSILVFNRNIAKEILKNMKARRGQADSDIMLSLLQPMIFQTNNQDAHMMRDLIKNIFKKREVGEDGVKKKPFSTFILKVKKSEGSEKAVELMECLFDKSHDPFTAQAISRFYTLVLKNWPKAKHFAEKATQLVPHSSYLWDTFGQVFKEELHEKFVSMEGPVGVNVVHEVISLTDQCIGVFRKEQEVSEYENSHGGRNIAGYFGELYTIISLIEALKKVSWLGTPADVEGLLMRRISCKHYLMLGLVPQEVTFLQNLAHCSFMAMRWLDDQFLQLEISSNQDVISNTETEFNRKSLMSVKVKLDECFGEPLFTEYGNLREVDKYELHRLHARRLGGTSLFQLMQKPQNVQKIFNLMLENLKLPTFHDLRTILDCTALLLNGQSMPRQLTFSAVLEWSGQLLMIGKSQDGYRHFLEPFLYFTMYNFPTAERLTYKLYPFADLSQAIMDWSEAFNNKFSKRWHGGSRQRPSTLFFLGNGNPPHDIVVHNSSPNIAGKARPSGNSSWQLPEDKSKLRRMQGLLLNNGNKIKVQVIYPGGNTFQLDITTSAPIKRRDSWQKKVYFYLGFSFSGPKAFMITPDETCNISK